jgi:hypothetical protein
MDESTVKGVEELKPLPTIKNWLHIGLEASRLIGTIDTIELYILKYLPEDEMLTKLETLQTELKTQLAEYIKASVE